MNTGRAFLRLVRWSNLVFIVLTQALFYWCVYYQLFAVHDVKRFFLLMIASVLIAAAGYIINDYFDLNIDQINKPDKIIIDRIIPRRWAIVWHLVLSFAGVALTAVAVGRTYWYLVVANFVCVILLWLYSTSFKRQLLIGNIVISLLTAWTILVLFFAFSHPDQAFNTTDPLSVKFFRISILYAGFAFIISLIREAVKDMEDMKGDMRYGCKTLPIVAGIRTTKMYVAIWIGVLVATLLILQFYVLQFGWIFSVLYAIAFVIVPLLMALSRLRRAARTADFAYLSGRTKWIMLTGILSMLFFLFYI